LIILDYYNFYDYYVKGAIMMTWLIFNMAAFF